MCCYSLLVVGQSASLANFPIAGLLLRSLIHKFSGQVLQRNGVVLLTRGIVSTSSATLKMALSIRVTQLDSKLVSLSGCLYRDWISISFGFKVKVQLLYLVAHIGLSFQAATPGAQALSAFLYRFLFYGGLFLF